MGTSFDAFNHLSILVENGSGDITVCVDLQESFHHVKISKTFDGPQCDYQKV